MVLHPINFSPLPSTQNDRDFVVSLNGHTADDDILTPTNESQPNSLPPTHFPESNSVPVVSLVAVNADVGNLGSTHESHPFPFHLTSYPSLILLQWFP